MGIQSYVQSFSKTVTRPRVYLLLLIAFIMLFAWMEMPQLPYSAADFAVHTNGGAQLDMRIGYSPAQAYETIGSYGADGRAYYINKLLINDMVFPVVYSLLFSATLAVLLNRLTGKDSRLRYLALLPLAGGILDLLENAGLVSMLLMYPGSIGGIATVTSMITIVKLAINMTSMLGIGVGLVAVICDILLKAWKSRGLPEN